MHPFRAAVEARDFDALRALLAEDVVFRSPVAFSPYEGRDLVAAILVAVAGVFEDFRYESEIGADDANEHVLVFRAEVNAREVHGADFLKTNPDGSVAELTVMVRPLSAANALAQRMALEFKEIQAALTDGPSA